MGDEILPEAIVRSDQIKHEEEEDGFTLDKAFVQIRGNYCFYIVILSIFTSFAFGEFVLFNLPFLQMIPPTECFNFGTMDWEVCDKEAACKPGILVRPVQGDYYHLENWTDDFDVICASDF